MLLRKENFFTATEALAKAPPLTDMIFLRRSLHAEV